MNQEMGISYAFKSDLDDFPCSYLKNHTKINQIKNVFTKILIHMDKVTTQIIYCI